MSHLSANARTFAAVIAFIAWFALGLQLYILIRNAPENGLTTWQATGRFFGYFTILTNLLVALSLTISLLSRESLARFFSVPSTQTAIAVYIFAVGLGYNILLRHLWKPQGLQWLADELLHDMVPLLYLLFWIFCVAKQELKWKNIFPWLLYPYIYLVFALVRGSVDGFYAYPFINADGIGYAAVLMNAVALFIVFVILSSLFVGIAKLRKNR
jgi:hypothetical protein